MVDDGETGSPPPGVLARASLLLEAISEAGVLGVSALARTTGMAKTTVHRMANELAALELVERSGDGFRLGPKLFELGSRVPRRRHFREAALPFLEDLSRASGQTVHLAVLDGTDVFYVERLVGARSAEVPSAVADRLPLHCTATGKCLLAFGPTTLTDQILAEPLAELTPQSITDPDRLIDALATVRNRGVAIETGEVRADLCSLAAPVWAFGQRLAGALSATGPIDDYDVDRNEELVGLAAAALSRRLGHDGAHPG